MAIDIPTLQVKLKFGQKDVTTTLSEFITQIDYTDGLGAQDSIKLTLDDSKSKWRGDWYPIKTDELSLEFGYAGEKTIKAKCFIDTITIKGKPDIIEIGAISGVVSEDLNTNKNATFEKKTLKQIVQQIAESHGLKVQGEIESITVKRRTQKDVSDYAFLEKLAKDFGYYFAVKNKQLIFCKKDKVKKDSSSLEITPQHCYEYSFTDKTSKVYKACTVRSWDPASKKFICHTEQAKGLKTGDELIITRRVENAEQAKALAKAALTARNERQVNGTLKLIGQHYYVAGVQLNLSGFGLLSGIYTVSEAKHTINSSGWTVSLTVARNELKADDPKDEKAKKSGNGKPSVKNPNGWTHIVDDDGTSHDVRNETAACFNKLKTLVHKRWPGQPFWVSCTTEGKHSSQAHPDGRAIDCGVDGISAKESYVLESLAQSVGFKTYNEYVNDSTYKTGGHMHIYI